MIDSNWHDACQACVGRTQSSTDALNPHAANGMLATLNDNAILSAGQPMPSLFHWLYFNEVAPTNQLKTDGHEVPGSFLPPVRYPHRMWAGSNIDFHRPLILGKTTQRISSIHSVDFKSGSSGALCFVKVEHRYRQHGTLCLTDLHTIVYREHTAENNWRSAVHRESAEKKSDNHSLDSIVLFRYSALTFNSHRIHFDQEYCKNVEGYPGLVVHGPLMATLLIRHIQTLQPELTLSNFSFRGHAPVFEHEHFELVAQPSVGSTSASLIKCDGTIAMSAIAAWVC